jgi:hypothetical protein
MKKLTFLLTGLFFMILSLNSQVQQKTGVDYFEGKWSVVVKGTPSGNAKMFIVLNKKDATLTGVVQDSTGKETSKIDKVELSGDKAIVYYNSRGYDINLEMEKKMMTM